MRIVDQECAECVHPWAHSRGVAHPMTDVNIPDPADVPAHVPRMPRTMNPVPE